MKLDIGKKPIKQRKVHASTQPVEARFGVSDNSFQEVLDNLIRHSNSFKNLYDYVQEHRSSIEQSYLLDEILDAVYEVEDAVNRVDGLLEQASESNDDEFDADNEY